MAPAEALETAVAACQIPGIVLRWSGSADIGRIRLPNLDALILMARQYETLCAGAKHAASVSGLLLWFNEQASAKGDSLALPAIDAVQVMTHHKAKGLEWPVVVLMDTHGEVKDALWSALRAGSRQPITAADPLRDRTLRLWPWPFGQQKKLAFKDEVAAKAVGQKFHKIAVEESKRVLYVSVTRARDLLLFAVPAKTSTGPWIETLEAPWMVPNETATQITLPTGEVIPLLQMPEPAGDAAVSAPEQLWWYREPTDRQERLPRTFNPSKAASPEMAVAEMVTIGERLSIGTGPDWTTVGHAVHAAIALAFVDVSAVDARGQRFVDEACSYHHIVLAMRARIAQTGQIGAWLVCDATFVRRYGLGAIAPGTRRLERWVSRGYVSVGQSLAELARRAGIDRAALAATVQDMNRAAQLGVDPVFGKGSTRLDRFNGDPAHRPNPCLGPIAQPPFVALPILAADAASSAGLATDADGRVLNAAGEPLAGLYACGNDAASVMRGTYPGLRCVWRH